MEDGYGRFCVGRFMQTLEYREDVFPKQPRAGPFLQTWVDFSLASSLDSRDFSQVGRDAQGWSRRPVILPADWTAIEIERLWIGGRPYKLVARQGEERALMTPLRDDVREG